MAICTITWAHNEEDILEYFVRHHCTFIDKMTIILHRSTDASYDILSDLIQEGLPIEIQENHTMHHAQSMFLTHALHQSANAYDWILPLDADEFLCSEGKDVQKELQCHTLENLHTDNERQCI